MSAFTSRDLISRVIAPLAVSASVLIAAFMLSGAPPAVHADIPAAVGPGTMTPSLAPMLKRAMPGVVNISVTGTVEVQDPFSQFRGDPLFRRFFGEQEEAPTEREFQSVGSGVIVDAGKGYLLTNSHVVEHAKEIKVRLNDDREFDAKLVGRDEETDIAVLQMEAKNLTAVPMGNSEALEVGDFVVAIGSPFNLRQTVTSGIVSALGRSGVSDGIGDFIQTDASINPGNSGGALVNLKGELVGIPSMIYSRSGGNIGIGFAIPVNQARNIMDQLVDHGSIERGRIGIQGGQSVTPELAKALELPHTRGALIGRVMPDSPAAKAGLKAGDFIVEANGKAIENFPQLRSVVGLLRVGDMVTMKFYRDGKLQNAKVKIGKNEDAVAPGAELNPALAGASFAAVDDSAREATVERGILVRDVAQGSPAARNGLRPGDVITAVNRKPVETLADFNALTTGKGRLLLQIQRGDAALFLLIGE
jgi:serine protease Do/serine protease DegQ